MSKETTVKKKISYRIYRIIRWLVWLFYPKMKVVGAENIPKNEPIIAVGNHTQMNGPIACELYFPVERYTWCAGEMMHLQEVPAYAYRDFWSGKPGWIRWFYKLFSYIIAPISVCVFNNANTIGVYHDTRIITTFRQSIEKMQQGLSMVIFPECAEPYNNIIYRFQDKFIDLARFYYKKTGEEIAFIPLYIAPALKTMYFGRPIRFRADVPIAEERSRICGELMDSITEIARGLPEHRVVPYLNLPKKEYPSNIPCEVNVSEENPV